MKLRRERLESGQGFTEYALLLALVSVASLFVLNALFGVLQDSFVTVLCEMRDLGRGETNCNFDGGQIVEEEVTDNPDAPTAVFNILCNINTCDFDFAPSFDTNGTIVQYEFSWGDGTSLQTITSVDPEFGAELVTKVYPTGAAGTTDDYFVAMRVTDDEGLTDTTARLITISHSNQAPIVDFLTSAFSAGQYQFDPRRTSSGTDRNGGTSYSTAPATYDPDGSIAQYKWDIYNSANVNVATQTYTAPEPQIFNHTFNPAGTYRVELTVTDSQSPAQTTKVTRYVTVTGSGVNSAPIISNIGILDDNGDFCNSGACECQKDNSFTATCQVLVQITDPEGQLDGNNIFIDIVPSGGTPGAGVAANLSQVTVGGVDYWTTTAFALNTSDNGDHDIYVNATDSGSPPESASGSATVNILMNNPPTFVNTPEISKTFSGTTITVDAPATDLDGDTLTYTWRFDDDANPDLESGPDTQTGSQATFTFTATGSRAIRITVSDGVTTDDIVVDDTATVGNNPPSITGLSVTSNGTPPNDESVFTFVATSSDPEGDPVEYCWDFRTTDLDSGYDNTQRPTCTTSDTVQVRYCSDVLAGYTVLVYAKDAFAGEGSVFGSVATGAITSTGCSGGGSVTPTLTVDCDQATPFTCLLENTTTDPYDSGTVEYQYFVPSTSTWSSANISGATDTSATFTATSNSSDPVQFRIRLDSGANLDITSLPVEKAPQAIWVQSDTIISRTANAVTVEVTLYQQSDTTDAGQLVASGYPITVNVAPVGYKSNGNTNNPENNGAVSCQITTGSTCQWTYTKNHGQTNYINYTYTLTTTGNYPLDTTQGITSGTTSTDQWP